MNFWTRLVLTPTAKRISTRKAEVRIRSATGVMQLWAEPSDGVTPDNDPQLIVLRLLGSRGRAEQATQDPANRLNGVRSVTWTLNPPSFGASSGPMSAERVLQSALDAYDFLTGRYAGVPIWVYGKCIGGTIALALAAERKPAALIIKNAIDVPERVLRRTRRWLPMSLAQRISRSVPRVFSPKLSAPQAKGPALFVISSNDSVASPISQEAIVACYGGPAEKLRVLGEHDQRALDPVDEPHYAAMIAALWTHTGSLAQSAS